MRSCLSVILPEADRRRLRLTAAALELSQGELVRRALSDRLAEIEGADPLVRRILAVDA